MPSLEMRDVAHDELMQLELEDGAVCQGFRYGARKSVSGECVFSTGLVGYPESLTDPSYRGQILILTFPEIGNYGVPSRIAMDALLKDIPAYFEASEIHVAGLITASYSGENYSHFLAESSLGTWLLENDIPAMHGVDTRALTKRIRDKGSMLGRMLLQEATPTLNGHLEDALPYLTDGDVAHSDIKPSFEHLEMRDASLTNLVAEGMSIPAMSRH